ncbi:hypothetical protein [Croceibacter atlanticus]|jgi:hypothetical protein|uniref:Uncharacterized protein n=1 Tax=Croceibacter atlanticus (strain ATCC BAA-628 / JCM 21780 / CIP 108009 / IAM 15332 / KCTC 12090 / HTCC2559) TaxID=216432 RepID=A3U6S2_CROAH|nr:hypothetical protein [Croceibacter atlanticus]EAP87939.1 hypothetical protein CA2559_04250 [Croceibacter atlanticus HTCC2559]
MENDNIICTVHIGDGMKDNDFTFYEDGRIKRFWDENQWSYNNEAFVEHNQIRESYKTKILAKLQGEMKDRVSSILYPSS